MLAETLSDIGDWINETMPLNLPKEFLAENLTKWMAERAVANGLTPADQQAYEISNPSWTSAAGISRYWYKFRVDED